MCFYIYSVVNVSLLGIVVTQQRSPDGSVTSISVDRIRS